MLLNAELSIKYRCNYCAEVEQERGRRGPVRARASVNQRRPPPRVQRGNAHRQQRCRWGIRSGYM